MLQKMESAKNSAKSFLTGLKKEADPVEEEKKMVEKQREKKRKEKRKEEKRLRKLEEKKKKIMEMRLKKQKNGPKGYSHINGFGSLRGPLEICPGCKKACERTSERVVLSGKEWHRMCWLKVTQAEFSEDSNQQFVNNRISARQVIAESNSPSVRERMSVFGTISNGTPPPPSSLLSSQTSSKSTPIPIGKSPLTASASPISTPRETSSPPQTTSISSPRTRALTAFKKEELTPEEKEMRQKEKERKQKEKEEKQKEKEEVRQKEKEEKQKEKEEKKQREKEEREIKQKEKEEKREKKEREREARRQQLLEEKAMRQKEKEELRQRLLEEKKEEERRRKEEEEKNLAKPAQKTGLVFGAPLKEVLLRENRGSCIPLVVEKCISYIDEIAIEEEGIFRISPVKTELEEYVEAFDRGEEPEFTEDTNPHVVAGLLKLYLRELPDPLTSFDLYSCWISVWKIPDEEIRLDRFKKLIWMLPDVTRLVVHYIINFVYRISEHSDKNKMVLSNCAVVFGPALIRPKEVSLDMMNNSQIICEICIFFVRHRDYLFSEVEEGEDL